MKAVTVSPKYQVVIPRAVRESLDIKPEQKVQVIVFENRIELLPIRAISTLRGFLRGIDTSVSRKDNRL